jgi:cysteinyl-tRNA synthetase
MRKKGKAARLAVDQAQAGFRALEAELGIGAERAEVILLRIRDRRAKARGLDAMAIERRIADRTEARKSKDFAEADRIRDELAERGVELLDGPEGTGWTMAD